MVRAGPLVDDPLLARDGKKLLLNGIVCMGCGHVSFPVRPVCPNCRETEVEDKPIGAYATLQMHTVSHVAPDGFEAPLVQAWVELDEGPEIFCLLLCTVEDAVTLSTGQRLEFEAVADSGEQAVKWGYRLLGAGANR